MHSPLDSSASRFLHDSNIVILSTLSGGLPLSDLSLYQRDSASVSHQPVTTSQILGNDDVGGEYVRRRAFSAGAITMKENIPDNRRGRTTVSEGGRSVVGSRYRGISLPRHAISPSISSSSSEQSSPLTPAHSYVPTLPNRTSVQNFQQARDSMLTQHSGTSSSLYPRSSVTNSGVGFVLPVVVDQNNVDSHIRIFDPLEQSELQSPYGFDADDVSYRLQLLVKNNYYLPPAHKKPFVPDISVGSDSVKKTSSKVSTPAFLDLFKITRSRPKTSSPTATKFPKGSEGPGPILRTTSDSSTISIYRQQPTTGSLPTTPLIPMPKPAGRVVVVRERMEDVAIAAKQSEKDLKVREKERNSRRSGDLDGDKNLLIDDIIDPTDAVDIPPPTPGEYPFPPQASALNALGIEASIGAAILAERLPPANEWSWTMDAEEDSWRKALLHEAVSHSLNNSVIDSPSSSPAVVPSTLERNATASSNSSNSTSSAMRRKRQLGQRILPHIPDEEVDRLTVQSPKPYALTAEMVRRSNSTDPQSSFGMFSLPGRVETPIPPPQPLAPPPRKMHNTSVSHASLSESDVQRSNDVLSSARLPWSIRKTMSDPVLSNTSDAHFLSLSNRADILTPPLLGLSRVTQADLDTKLLCPNTIEDGTSTQYYSDDQLDDTVFHSATEEHYDAEEPPRPSLSVSMHSVERTSSEYIRPLPGLRDTMASPEGDSVVYRQWQRTGLDSITRASSTFGDYVSPPPRTSSAFSHHALTPAPRSRAMYATVRSQITSRGQTHTSVSHESMSSRGQHSFGTDALHEVADFEEQDIADTARTEVTAINHTNLALPNDSHGNREPPSPISFFDEIEMQHGPSGCADTLTSNILYRQVEALPEEDTSDIENTIYVDPASDMSSGSVGHQSASTLMRLGNRSNPYIITTKNTTSDKAPVSYDMLDRKRAIMNTAGPSSPRSRFFVSQSTDANVKTFDMDQAATAKKNQRPTSSPDNQPRTGLYGPGLRPRTANSEISRSPRAELNPLENDSQRLDGLLLEHIEKERDTLRRITSTLAKS